MSKSRTTQSGTACDHDQAPEDRRSTSPRPARGRPPPRCRRALVPEGWSRDGAASARRPSDAWSPCRASPCMLAESASRSGAGTLRRRRLAPSGAGPPVDLEPPMGLFNKILHAGEGRKLKSLETIAAVRRRVRGRDAGPLRRRPARAHPTVAGGARQRGEPRGPAGAPRRPPARGLRRGAGSGRAHARPTTLRRADHGRRRAALRLGRGDEDRRGQDARRHAPRVPQRADRRRRAPRHRERLPGPSATRSGWVRSTACSGSMSAS